MTQDPHLYGLTGPVIHDEAVAARAPWRHRVNAGETLRVVDLEGNQAVDFLLYAAADDAERYSAQDTIAAQANIFLRTGSTLLSNEGRPMMTITATSVDYHDTIGGACSCRSTACGTGITPRRSIAASTISSKPICATVAASATSSRTSTFS